MKKVLIGAALLGIGALIYLYLGQVERVKAAEIEAARLEVERVALVEEAERIQFQADSVKAVLDSLEVVRTQEKAEAAARALELAARADEMEAAISGLLPPEIVDTRVRDQVMLAVAEIRGTYETRLNNQAAILRSTELSLDTALREGRLEREVNENLAVQITLLEEERDAWKVAAQPTFFGRLKSESGLLSGALTLGVLATLALGG